MPLPENGTALQIRLQVPLKPHTTFKVGGPARYFAEVRTASEIREAMAFAKSNGLAVFVLGGGSNILVSDHGFDGLVVHPAMKGLEVIREDAHAVSLRASSAEAWDDVVAYTVEQGWWGIENLSHIPGQAGAALVQNIGAYGQQLSDVAENAEVIDLATGEVKTVASEGCGLGYRTSMFNSTHKGLFLILGLTLRLSKYEQPNLQYADVRKYFGDGVAPPAQREIRQAIILIRDAKFPFPREERGGNAGSFFKNLVLTPQEYGVLESRFRANFDASEVARLRALRDRFAAGAAVKIPTAFLIEVCRLKGHQVGRARAHVSQPLVLLNQGGATARDILTLAGRIRRAIYEKTGAKISLEPELVGFEPGEAERYLAAG